MTRKPRQLDENRQRLLEMRRNTRKLRYSSYRSVLHVLIVLVWRRTNVESPRWLLLKGKPDKAKEMLKQLNIEENNLIGEDTNEREDA